VWSLFHRLQQFAVRTDQTDLIAIDEETPFLEPSGTNPACLLTVIGQPVRALLVAAAQVR